MEIFKINQNTKIILSSLFVAVVLIFAIMFGISNGKKIVQSEIVFVNAKALVLGLNYFYNDQERYPNNVEFSDNEVMLNYFSTFPPKVIIGGKCAESYVYKRESSKKFTLNFCLVDSYNKAPSGWSQIIGNDGN